MTGSALSGLTGLGARAADPPLDPSPDEARSLLRRELLKPGYNDQNIVERLLRWFERRINGGIDAAASLGPVQTVVAMILFLVLVAGLTLLLSRARRTERADRPAAAVLTDEVITATELRARAEAALVQGLHEVALLDAFRALAMRQVERGRLEDSPGATAHEVAYALADEYPHQRDTVYRSADMFDLVLYGERSATREQAQEVLRLDDEMALAR